MQPAFAIIPQSCNHATSAYPQKQNPENETGFFSEMQ